MSPIIDRQRGFTLVELIVVMILIGILGAVGASRFFDRHSFDGRAFADQASALLRYAQKQAIAQRRDVHVRFERASIALCYDAACAAHVRTPSGQNHAPEAACENDVTWFCLPLPRASTLIATPFFFDAGGRPCSASDATDAALSTFVSQAIKINGVDGATYEIQIENETGYVH
jgi:MSHA pilin protein MshC